MADKSFKETFAEVGAAWPTKSGKGVSMKFKVAIPPGIYVQMFENRNKETDKHPSHNLFVKREDLPADAEGGSPDTEAAPF